MKKAHLTLLTLACLMASAILWTRGLLHSPLMNPEQGIKENYTQQGVSINSPEYQKEKLLAESYWLRYEDVKNNPYWGISGPKGFWGARDHFVLHGKQEGRIFAPVIQPPNPTEEKELATAYWQRYPEIRQNSIWGEKSPLATLGPRDHYTYIGRFEGRIWGNIMKKGLSSQTGNTSGW